MVTAAMPSTPRPSQPVHRQFVSLAVLAVALLVTTALGPMALAAPVPRPDVTTSHGFVLSDYESALLDGLNAQRVTAGLPAFRLSGGATDVARRWARQLTAAGALSHNPNLGPDLDANGSAGWTSAGENVATGGSAQDVVTAWMSSAPHRANILNAKFTVIGMGAITGGGRTWSVTEFADVADGRTPTTSPDTAGVATAPVPPSTTRIAALTSANSLMIKEGGLYDGWTTVASGVTAYGLDRLRVGVVTGGVAMVKDGTLNAGWITLADGARGITLASGRIAVLGNDGSVRVKDGAVNNVWTTVWSSGASAVVVTDSRVAVISGGMLYAKEGSLSAGWVLLANGATDISLSGSRLAAVFGGTAYAKQGSLFEGWVALAPASRVALSDDRIGVLDGTDAIVKDGLFSAWTTVANRTVTALSLTSARVAVVDAGTVRVKEGSLTSAWVDVSSGTGVLLSR